MFNLNESDRMVIVRNPADMLTCVHDLSDLKSESNK